MKKVIAFCACVVPAHAIAIAAHAIKVKRLLIWLPPRFPFSPDGKNHQS
jgi:hypothetical protein